MSQFWDDIAARSNGQHTAQELEAAAYRLVTEQVLYYADRHSRTAYWMLERYERDFKQALAPLGITVEVNRQQRYVYALPRHLKAGTASVAQTVLALVLRAIYDESARIGQFTDDGEVICDLVELDEKYRLMTNRELPAKGELDALMKSMKRWGIAKKSDEYAGDGADDLAASQPYTVIIRPAIVDLLGETALQRIAEWRVANPDTANADGGNEEVERHEDEGTGES
jgi:hypothetical protein